MSLLAAESMIDQSNAVPECKLTWAVGVAVLLITQRYLVLLMAINLLKSFHNIELNNLYSRV